jgi:dTDP-4-amino-4,6-dideoxygalactose transaminase
MCALPLNLLEFSFPVSQSSTSKTAHARNSAPVPMLDLGRQYAQVREEILAAVERVCSSQHFILGAEVEALEREISAFCGTADAVGCASGTDALWLALLAVGVQPGDSVITTAFSFFASTSAIVRAGARPVLLDVDPHTLNLDPTQVEAHLRAGKSTRLRALLPVHLYGQCADMDAFEGLADEFQLSIVEDAAQAIGAAWHERRAGSLGAAAAFSFYPSKNLSAYGDAGLVTTNDPKFAAHMRRLRNHGSPRRYLHEEFGWNSRLDAIQAAVLRVKLPHIEKWNQQRRERAATYDRLLTQSGLISATGASPLRVLSTTPHAHHVYHQYVLRAQRRDELRQFLTDRQIGTEIYYPIPLHLQPAFAYLGYCERDLPESERAAREVLALPMFPELTEDEQQWVVESVAQFYS